MSSIGRLIQRRQPFRWLAKVFRLPSRISVELEDIGSWVIRRLGNDSLRTLLSSLQLNGRTKREAEGV